MGKRPHASKNSEFKKKREEHAEKRSATRGDDQAARWEKPVLENARFEAFYKAQHFTNGDEDWGALMKHFQSTLPATFRLNPDYPFVDQLKAEVMAHCGETFEVDGQEIRGVEGIDWYPGGMGYKLGTDRRSIRKLDGLADLHKWMMQHTDNGNITRQEAVSMVPPLVLDVKPHHKCVDMCAAPGSKTSQLLEVVNRSMASPPAEQGLVVANDSSTDRAYMLVHQCRRINSPLLVVTNHQGQQFPSINAKDLVGASNGSSSNSNTKEFFDRVLCDVPCSGDGTLRKNPAIWAKWSTAGGMTLHPLQLMIAQRGVQLLKPGGVLVYSTCSMSPYENESVVAELIRSSGGKLELVDARALLPGFKARKGLSKWHVLDDANLVKKENELLNKKKKKEEEEKIEQQAKKKKFSFTFATSEQAAPTACASSADAVEAKKEGNDARVTQEDNVADSGTMEVSATAEAVPGAAPPAAARINAGVYDDNELVACINSGMTYYRDASVVPAGARKRIPSSMFEPSAEEAADMHLELCMRCVPQDEDTGGFFVAALRKKEDSTTSVPATAAAAAAAPMAAPAAKADDVADEKADPLQLADLRQWDSVSYNNLKEFYGFDAFISADSMFVRDDFEKGSKNKPQSKSVYYLPLSARQLLQSDRNSMLHVITAGIKMFERKAPTERERSDAESNGHPGAMMESEYRLMQDGVQYFAPHMSKRKMNVTIQDFCNMLGGGLVSQSTLSSTCLTQLAELSAGTVICTYTYDESDVVNSSGEGVLPREAIPAGEHKFHIVAWKGHTRTLNVMAGKIDIDFMKHSLTSLGVYREKIQSAAKQNAVAAAAAAADATVSANAESTV